MRTGNEARLSHFDRLLGAELLRIYALRVDNFNVPFDHPMHQASIQVGTYSQAMAAALMSKEAAEIFELARCAVFRACHREGDNSELSTINTGEAKFQISYHEALLLFCPEVASWKHCPECHVWSHGRRHKMNCSVEK